MVGGPNRGSLPICFTHRSLHRSSKDERTVTTACPQPGTENGLQRPTDLEGQTRAQLIMARRADLHLKAEYICADLSSRPRFSLAVARRTIHSHYLLNFSSASISCFIAAGPESSPTWFGEKSRPCRPTRRDASQQPRSAFSTARLLSIHL